MSSRDEKNLRMLQKLDSNAIGVVDQALFVAVYSFNEADQSWEKESIEGPLFLVNRNVDPQHCLIVVNRASSVNFVKLIEPGFEYDATEQYLMFRSEQGIYGLWFPEDAERNRFIDKVKKIVSKGKEEEDVEQEMPILLQKMMKQQEQKDSNNNNKIPATFNSSEQFTLSKEQMKDVLLRLVQTDKFIDILHNTYLKQVNGRSTTPPPGPPPQQQYHSPGPMLQGSPQMYPMHQSPPPQRPMHWPPGNGPMMNPGYGGTPPRPPPHFQQQQSSPNMPIPQQQPPPPQYNNNFSSN